MACQKLLKVKSNACNSLHGSHVHLDSVLGNSYAVKASGFATPGHTQDLGVFPGFAPKTEQDQVSFTKRKILRAGAPVVENVFIEQRIQLRQGDIEISGSFGFRIELFHWFERSCHSRFYPYPSKRMRGSKAVVPFMAGLRNQVNCPIAVSMTPYYRWHLRYPRNYGFVAYGG
jgi:hypothetical protein